LEALKVIANPLRTQIFELLISQIMRVKEICEQLGHPSSMLYYHIHLMEKHGFIQVEDTCLVSGITEKRYRASGRDLKVKPALLSPTTKEGRGNIDALITSTLETTHADILRSLEARTLALQRGAKKIPRQIMLTRTTSAITKDQGEDFNQRLSALIEGFEEAGESPHTQDRQLYALTAAFYPSSTSKSMTESIPPGTLHGPNP
jgi:predicted ArsR family transcriptional regulator